MLIFLTLVGAGLLALLVVVIYLNDRVNELERRSISSSMGSGWAGGNGNSGNADDNTWRGLTGKGLWDCMCGKQGASSLDAADVQALRLSYEGVLAQHIESLFRAGQADARRGSATQPTAVKTLGSPRGNVQSWIPLNHANALYRAGMDSTKSDIYEAERARMTLDETAQTLYAQTGLTLQQPISVRLLGDGDTSAGSEPVEESLAAPATADIDPVAASLPKPQLPSPPGGGMFSASTSASAPAPSPETATRPPA
jgi:hypothetical protein